MTDNIQDIRRIELRELVDIHHRSNYGDYNDTYDEFEATYLKEEGECERCEGDGTIEIAGLDAECPECGGDGELPAPQDIPQYASIASDETYGMIHLFDTLSEALADQAGISSNGEYLNVPGGVIDLDTGEEVTYVTVTLTPQAAALVGLSVATETEVRDVLGIDYEDGEFSGPHAGIEVWDEVRKAFPLPDKDVAKQFHPYNEV